MKTQLDLIRHGEPEGGLMYRGSGTDHPLSTLGWSQMWAAIEGKGGWDAVVTSPMLRCYNFAKQVADKYGLPLEIVHSLREAGYGEWEGLKPEFIRETQLLAYKALYADPIRHRPKGAEPLVEFTERVKAAFAYIETQYQHRHVLVVSHAGTMRAILCHLLGAPIASQQRINLPYAAFYSIKRDEIKGLQLEW